ncbi:hypothetical protein [Phytohabitans aurantiacus]|uniref:Uncharacterized protein n=1 Tax=Phytohabitans aurantiacus TaxID=3016789 RepID=A0ABQ5QK17_9ACTN|nr:hypothetical protein [Phytohabitans aurantiacus]GLH94885.1 hypothetical protein Pa4123_01570 [Phytohabitans aurantiacus]
MTATRDVGLVRVDRLKVGTWIVVFGQAAEVLSVRDSKAFPDVKELCLRPVRDSSVTATALFPPDWELLPIPWALSGTGPAVSHRAQRR